MAPSSVKEAYEMHDQPVPGDGRREDLHGHQPHPPLPGVAHAGGLMDHGSTSVYMKRMHDTLNLHWRHALYNKMECNCIVTRGGVYDEISPEPEGNPEGGARGISRGLR